MNCGLQNTLGVAGLLALAAVAPAAQKSEKVVWKPVEIALLKMDGRAPKHWEVYLAEKRKTLVLVQLGARFLLLHPDTKEIWELEPGSLERHGRELGWREPKSFAAEARSTQSEHTGNAASFEGMTRVETSEWSLRSAGRARILKVRLVAEGRVLEVQFPQRPDFRTLY
jgi:hypothetical protein